MATTSASTSGQHAGGNGWLPSTGAGWWAVAIAVLAIAWAALFPSLMSPLSERLHGTPFRWLSGGREGLTFALLLGVVAGALALRAMVAFHDRARLLWLALIPSLLMTLFWLIFAIGEVVSPH